MENSRKSVSDLSERVAGALSPVLASGSSILLGLSGGVDSVVLLHLLHHLAPRYSWHLSALHVHHGISPQADAWAAFCADLCARLHIPFQIEHVDIAPLRDMGIEAAARKVRHAALDRQPVDCIALAHHLDDQAETLLLQLLRGAGVRGASAMQLSRQRDGAPALLRPMLDVARSELVAYAQQHELQWVEDESNADESYPRNFLRQRVLPVLAQRFPSYRATLARSASHFAEASELLDQLAQQDAHGALYGGGLDVARLQALDLVRRKNLLRWFLHQCGATMPQAVQLDGMLQQLCDARQDAAVCVIFGGWQVRRYRGRAYALRVLDEFDRSLVLSWHGQTELNWPALNTLLHFSHTNGSGISLTKLQRAPCTLRLRSGGESLRPQLRAATRTLTNLLQEHAIPPWTRERLPLLYCGDELVCVPGVAIAAEYQAGVDEAGILCLVVHSNGAVSYHTRAESAL